MTLAFLSSRVPTLPKSRDRNLNIVRMKAFYFLLKGFQLPEIPKLPQTQEWALKSLASSFSVLMKGKRKNMLKTFSYFEALQSFMQKFCI